MSGSSRPSARCWAQLLESLDVDVPSVELGERRLHRVLKSTESYTTAVGPVKVARTLYRSARERAVVPMELRAGIVEDTGRRWRRVRRAVWWRR